VRPSAGEARLLRLSRRGARPGDERDANRARSRVRVVPGDEFELVAGSKISSGVGGRDLKSCIDTYDVRVENPCSEGFERVAGSPFGNARPALLEGDTRGELARSRYKV
jgi:hypothetical protein